MRTRTLARLAGLVASTTMLLLAVAPAALAKEGVSVNLVAPLPREAEPGTTVPATYTMIAIANDVESPLRGATTFLRLYGPGGMSTEAIGVEQATPGTYRAMITIPVGGVTRAEFGIRGPAKTASGKVVASDVVWAYDGVLTTAAAPAMAATPAATTEPATSSSFDPRLALALGLGAVTVVAAGLIGRRRRSQRSNGGVIAA